MVQTARDGDKMCYPVDSSWKNASMAYAHVLLDGNASVMTLSLEKAKFLMSRETYSKILEIAEEFRDSIKRALQSNEDKEEKRSTADTEEGEASESEAQKPSVYQNHRQRKGRGNRYRDIIACLR